jgi:predicted Rossmann fold nucleotide-binding protein DprA/Smf involved in DNA uptake
MNQTLFGNQKLLDTHKTAFLCSRKCPSDIILKSLDWAKGKKDKGECVISGFHSQIEKDVFNILLKGNQPIILVLARGMKKRWPAEIKEAIKNDRLLIISPFDESVKRITQETANRRNEIMADLADEIFLAYSTEGGNLYNLMEEINSKKIKVNSFKMK